MGNSVCGTLYIVGYTTACGNLHPMAPPCLLFSFHCTKKCNYGKRCLATPLQQPLLGGI